MLELQQFVVRNTIWNEFNKDNSEYLFNFNSLSFHKVTDVVSEMIDAHYDSDAWLEFCNDKGYITNSTMLKNSLNLVCGKNNWKINECDLGNSFIAVSIAYILPSATK